MFPGFDPTGGGLSVWKNVVDNFANVGKQSAQNNAMMSLGQALLGMSTAGSWTGASKIFGTMVPNAVGTYRQTMDNEKKQAIADMTLQQNLIDEAERRRLNKKAEEEHDVDRARQEQQRLAIVESTRAQVDQLRGAIDDAHKDGLIGKPDYEAATASLKQAEVLAKAGVPEAAQYTSRAMTALEKIPDPNLALRLSVLNNQVKEDTEWQALTPEEQSAWKSKENFFAQKRQKEMINGSNQAEAARIELETARMRNRQAKRVETAGQSIALERSQMTQGQVSPEEFMSDLTAGGSKSEEGKEISVGLSLFAGGAFLNLSGSEGSDKGSAFSNMPPGLQPDGDSALKEAALRDKVQKAGNNTQERARAQNELDKFRSSRYKSALKPEEQKLIVKALSALNKAGWLSSKDLPELTTAVYSPQALDSAKLELIKNLVTGVRQNLQLRLDNNLSVDGLGYLFAFGKAPVPGSNKK